MGVQVQSWTETAGVMWVVIIVQRHPVALCSSAKGHVENVSRYLPMEHQKESGHM